MVLPMYHSGMGDVQPKGSTVPRVGRHLTVTIGEPLDLRDITSRCNVTGENQQQVRFQRPLDIPRWNRFLHEETRSLDSIARRCTPSETAGRCTGRRKPSASQLAFMAGLECGHIDSSDSAFFSA